MPKGMFMPVGLRITIEEIEYDDLPQEIRDFFQGDSPILYADEGRSDIRFGRVIAIGQRVFEKTEHPGFKIGDVVRFAMGGAEMNANACGIREIRYGEVFSAWDPNCQWSAYADEIKEQNAVTSP